MLNILKQLLQLFSGGTKTVLVRIAGMFIFKLLSLWVDRLIKKKKREEREDGLEDNVDVISQRGADAVSNLKEAIKLNDEMMQKKDKENREKLKEMLTPKMQVLDSTITAGKPFVVEIKNVDAGLPIYADKTWKIGTTPVSGQVRLLLTSPGKRTLDIPLSEKDWFSIHIEVV